MFYRENGQFKTSYRADQQVFPIAQDRIAIFLLLAVAFLVVPMLATDGLQQLFGRPEPVAALLRNWGMAAFDASGPLKRRIARLAMGTA